MLQLSKKTFHAIEAVFHIAYHSGNEPLSARDIAKRQGLAPRHLEQIMQQLVRADILRGVRGPKGGYVLARERRRINIAEICAVIRAHDPLDTDELCHTELAAKVLLPLSQQLEYELGEQLSDVTLAQLCSRASDSGIARYPNEPTDYTI